MRHACTILVARATVLFMACLCLSDLVAAQVYPSKPIKLINPFAPGGPADIVSRAVMTKLSERLSQPIVIESRAGAAGAIASAAVAKSPPDGYTLLIGDLSPLVISPATRSDMPYDTLKDFVPVTQMVSGALVLVVRGDLPIKTIQDFVEYARSRPGSVSYGSAGTGTTTHLAGEMFEIVAKVDLLHAPYKGATPVITDLLGGQIDASFLNIAGLQPYFESGKLRPIAVTSAQRSSLMAELPAIAETYPGFDASSWYGIVAPAGTPKEIVARLEQEIRSILRSPEIVEFMRSRGLTVEATTSEQYAAKIRQDITKWEAVVRAAGLAPQKP